MLSSRSSERSKPLLSSFACLSCCAGFFSLTHAEVASQLLIVYTDVSQVWNLAISTRLISDYAMQAVKAITLGIIGGIIVTAFFLTCVMISLPTPNALATPAIGKGQPCKTCHTSSKPSKSDLKK